MDVSGLVGSSFLKGDDIGDKIVQKTIAGTRTERFEGDQRETVIVSFEGTDKEMTLNQTNLKSMIQFFGPDSDAWTGKAVTIMTVPGRRPDGQACLSLVLRKVEAGGEEPDPF